MNPKNTKKLPNHENACANIPCNFRDRDISRLGVAYLTHAIHTQIAGWIIVRFELSRIRCKRNWSGSLTVSCRHSSMQLRRIIVLGATRSMFSLDKVQCQAKVHTGDAEPMCCRKPASPMF